NAEEPDRERWIELRHEPGPEQVQCHMAFQGLTSHRGTLRSISARRMLQNGVAADPTVAGGAKPWFPALRRTRRADCNDDREWLARIQAFARRSLRPQPTLAASICSEMQRCTLFAPRL